MVLYICVVTKAALELYYSVYADRHTECISLPWAKVVYPQHKDAFTYCEHDNVWATEGFAPRYDTQNSPLQLPRGEALKLTFP